MTDRLAELTGNNPQSFESDVEDPQSDDVSNQSRIALQKFQAEADALSKAINDVGEAVGRIESQYKVSLDPHMTSKDKAHAETTISGLIQDNNKRTDTIRKQLRKIAGENKAFALEFPHKSGELRVRVNTHQAMTKNFMSSMQMFEDAQEKHRDSVSGAMERQLREINPQATDEEIRDAIRSGNTDGVTNESTMLKQLPMVEQQRLRNGLADLKSRNNDIKKLEESIIQLHQLFMDMQVLVDAQGELLNNIEYNVEETKGATVAAHEELVEARNHQKSAGKKKCCIALIIVAILLAIFVPTLIVMIPKWIPASSGIISHLPDIPGINLLPSPSPVGSGAGAPPPAPVPAPSASPAPKQARFAVTMR
jgi:t-SNARE complex subunit (syntaxin)